MTTSKRTIPTGGSTGLKITGPVIAHGIVVNSHSSGTLALYDATTGAFNHKFGVFTFATGSGVVTFPAPLEFENGVWAVVGGTLDASLLV